MAESCFRAVEGKLVHSENKGIDTGGFLEFVGCDNSEGLPEMVATRVIPSFAAAVRRHGVKTFDEESLRVWVASMVIRGMKFNQVKRYLGALHTLFTDWNSDKNQEDPFPGLMADLATPITFDAQAAADNMAGLRRIIDNEVADETSVALNVFLYLLYDVEAEFEDAVRLPVDYIGYGCGQISDLISRVPRRKRATYAFPLNQGNTTDRKIITDLQYDISALLEKARISFEYGGLRDSIRSLWITKALECGVGYSTIRGMVASTPAEYRVLDLVRPAQLTEKEKEETIRRVANHINDTTARWYIMRMRPKVTPEIVKEEIKSLNEAIYKTMDFYYPVYQTIEIDKNKRRKVIDNPYLPGVLFIRLRSDKVAYVVRRLTRHAWCYRWTRNPDSPYSTMSQREMEAFQMHIGRLTPDIRMQLEVREEPFGQDAEVMIAGGDRMVGHIGRITSVRNADGTRTYSLEITNNLSAKWTVADIDEVFLKEL